MGSGSQIFASYMALRENWYSASSPEQVEELEFAGEESASLWPPSHYIEITFGLQY